MNMNYRIQDQSESAEYIEKLIPFSIDDPITYGGSIEFRFGQYRSEYSYTYPIPGLRTGKRREYIIKTNADLPFKPGDIIRFGRDDKRRYTITKIDYDNSETNYRKTYLYPTEVENVQYKIITLE